MTKKIIPLILILLLAFGLRMHRLTDVPPGLTGAGTAIAIVDPYGSPTLQSDLDTFSATMGIPSTQVHVYCPNGCPATSTAQHGAPFGWAGETSLEEVLRVTRED